MGKTRDGTPRKFFILFVTPSVSNDSDKGLEDYKEAVNAWKRAIQTLPIENLSPTEVKLKREYQLKLSDSQNSANGIFAHASRGPFPWTRAKEMARVGNVPDHSSVGPFFILEILNNPDRVMV